VTETEQNSNVPNYLQGVDFIDTDMGWTVGEARTILRTTSGGMTHVEEIGSSSKSDRFVLMQNHPNPFHSSTQIDI
jgi:hypothetical protein